MNIAEGTDVYGSDGEKVGSISAVQANYVVVEKGFFFPTDYYIPVSAITGVDDGRIYLNVTKDAALNEGWDTLPADYESDVVVTDTVGTAPVGTYDTGTAVVDTDVDRTVAARGVRQDTVVTDDDTISIPVHEESLTATKTSRELGEVQIEKDVVAEDRTISVPVTEERVRVSRTAVDRPVGADEHAFEEGVIEVPVYGEDVQLQKQVRVTEEVEIDKEAVQKTEQVSGTVRHEEVRVVGDVVDSAGVADADVNRRRGKGGARNS